MFPKTKQKNILWDPWRNNQVDQWHIATHHLQDAQDAKELPRAKLQPKIQGCLTVYGDQKPTGETMKPWNNWLVIMILRFFYMVIISYHYGLYLNPYIYNWVIHNP